MSRIPDAGILIPQLQEITAVFDDDQCRNGVANGKRSLGVEKMINQRRLQ